jgi:hypothetical protein
MVCNHVEERDGLRDRLGGVVCAEIEVGTLRAEICEPREGLTESASACSGQAGDHAFALVPALPIGADAASRVVAEISAPTRRGTPV